MASPNRTTYYSCCAPAITHVGPPTSSWIDLLGTAIPLERKAPVTSVSQTPRLPAPGVPECLELVERIRALQAVSLSVGHDNHSYSEETLTPLALSEIEALLVFGRDELFPAVTVMRLVLDGEGAVLNSLRLFPGVLRTLALTLRETRGVNERLWRNLLASSPLLEELHLFGSRAAIDSDEADELSNFILPILSGLKNLRILRLPVDVFLLRDIIVGLSVSTISSITVDDTNQPAGDYRTVIHHPPPTNADLANLANITYLRFAGSWYQIDVLRQSRVRLPQLQCLVFELPDLLDPYGGGRTIDYLPILAPGINHLCMTFKSSLRFPSSHFRVIKTFAHLTSLDIATAYGVDIDDAGLADLGRDLPGLEHLHLSPASTPPGRRPRLPTIAGLAALAATCPNMKTIGVHLSTKSRAITPSSLFFPCLETLDLGTSVPLFSHRHDKELAFPANLANLLPDRLPNLISTTLAMDLFYLMVKSHHDTLLRVQLAKEKIREEREVEEVEEVEGLVDVTAELAIGGGDVDGVEDDDWVVSMDLD